MSYIHYHEDGRPMTVMTPSDDAVVARALAFVAEFKGDNRCSLNCFHAEALGREVHRLREAKAEATNLVTLGALAQAYFDAMVTAQPHVSAAGSWALPEWIALRRALIEDYDRRHHTPEDAASPHQRPRGAA